MNTGIIIRILIIFAVSVTTVVAYMAIRRRIQRLESRNGGMQPVVDPVLGLCVRMIAAVFLLATLAWLALGCRCVQAGQCGQAEEPGTCTVCVRSVTNVAAKDSYQPEM